MDVATMFGPNSPRRPPALAVWDQAGRLRSRLPRALMLALFAAGPVGVVAPLWMAPLFIATAVSLGGLYAWHCRQPVETHQPVVVLCLWFGLYAGLSLLWTPEPGHASYTVVELAVLFLPAFLLIGMIAVLPEPVRPGLESAYLAGTATALLLLVGVTFESPAPTVTRALAAAALLIWPAAIILYRRGRVALAHLAPVALAGFYLWTAPGTAAAGLIAGLATVAIGWRSVELARRLIGAALVVCFVAVVPIVHGLDAFELETAEWLPAPVRDRLVLWEAVADRVLERPLFGHGINSDHGADRAGAELGSEPPRDLFLQIWVELGAVGAGLGLALALAALAALRTLPDPWQRFALAGYATVWVLMGSAGGVWQPWWLATILMTTAALALAARITPAADQTQPRPLASRIF